MFNKAMFLFHGAVNASVVDLVLGTVLQDCRIIDIWGVMTGAGASGDTVKVTNGTNDITTAQDVSAKGDKALFKFIDIDDAYRDLTANTLIHAVNASGALCDVYVLAVPMTP